MGDYEPAEAVGELSVGRELVETTEERGEEGVEGGVGVVEDYGYGARESGESVGRDCGGLCYRRDDEGDCEEEFHDGSAGGGGTGGLGG